MTYLPGNEGDPPRVAYAIGRHVGGAVERNQLRRRLRAVLVDLARRGEVAPGTYLIGASPAAAGMTIDRLLPAVRDALAAVQAQARPPSGAPA